jgi:hypothetical protein
MKRTNRLRTNVWVLLLVLALSCCSAWAIFEKGDFPWKVKLHAWQENPMNEALGDCWYLNVGPTGLRAQITHEHPSCFTIRYVFKGSPAAGKIRAGDIVVGANGTMLQRPHRFGRRTVDGWDGPLVDMAELIEDSQGRDGKLDLIVWPGGDRGKQKTVTLRIKPVGRFSPTYPFNCRRSDKLVAQFCDALVETYEMETPWKKRNSWRRGPHTTSHCILALMASGDRKYERLVKTIMSGYAGKRYDSTAAGGFPSWGCGYDGIVMGEYYLRYKDKRLSPAMESLARYYEEAQDWRSGGNSHKPFPAIQRRIAGGGPKGYGAMASPGGLAMLAMSLFRAGGQEYSELAYERIHQAYLLAAKPDVVSIVYGFPAWNHATITLEDKSKARSGKGTGYRCPAGMKGIGKYTVTWPTKADPRWKPTDWVAGEADRNTVFESADWRLVVRTMAKPEPTTPYHTTRFCSEAPVGLGALAHLIGNKGNRSWEYLGEHCANSCALGPREWLQGHASSSMHQLWVALGASRGDEKAFRGFMDQVKWWFIMQEDFRGSCLILPDRDRDTNSDPYYAPHMLPTANAAIVLALARRRLQITGAGMQGSVSAHSPRGPSARRSAPEPRTRNARTLAPERLAALNGALLSALAKLSGGKALAPKPVLISKTRAKVWLAEAGDDGRLTFQVAGGTKKASFAFDDLSPTDHATLSLLVAELKADSPDAQAMAGVYLEAVGRVDDADRYFTKAGETSRSKLEKLFD